MKREDLGKGATRDKKTYVLAERPIYNHSGDDGKEDPPVPIPNTEVKLNCAESTCLDTTWEDRELPHFIIPLSLSGRATGC